MSSSDAAELAIEAVAGASRSPTLRVTPDKYLTVAATRAASGDFNPIHIDEQSSPARSGLPGRILHGLWTMAQVARAETDAAGGPEHLKRLSVQFRGMGHARAGGRRERNPCARSARRARDQSTRSPQQAGIEIIRNAEAELEL